MWRQHQQSDPETNNHLRILSEFLACVIMLSDGAPAVSTTCFPEGHPTQPKPAEPAKAYQVMIKPHWCFGLEA